MNAPKVRDDEPKKFAYYMGYMCTANADGSIPINSRTYTETAIVAHCNHMIADRDRLRAENARLREALEYIVAVTDLPQVSQSKARAALAKDKP